MFIRVQIIKGRSKVNQMSPVEAMRKLVLL